MYLRRYNQGLTLLELMVTVAIVAILITSVGPSIQSILITNKITADVNSLSSILRFARHTAVNNQTSVTLCATTDYSKCSTEWQNAKMVFIDENENNQRDDEETLLVAGDPISGSNSISGASAAIIFEEDGSLDSNSALALQFCPNNSDDDSFSRAVVVTAFGRISVGEADSDGDALSCD